MVTAAGNGRVRFYRLPADQLLRTLPPGSIDLLLTDPPYASVDRHGTDYLRHWFRGAIPWPEIGGLLRLARTRLRPDGLALVMSNQAGLEPALHAVCGAGFVEPVQVIVWDKRSPGLGGKLRHQVEYVLVGRQVGSRPLVGTDLVAVAAVGPGTADRYPTQKPEGLGRALAAMAGIGRKHVVLDPFCGSGALLVGAAERGATVIGGDISAKAVATAMARVSAALGPRSHASGRAAKRRPPSYLEGRRRRAAPAYRRSAQAGGHPSPRRPT